MDEDKVVEMKPVSLYEVKEILKERKKEKELNYEQEITMKYAEKFAKLTEKQTEDLLKAFKEIEFLKDREELKYQILAALPENPEQLRLFLPKDVEASEEDLKKVTELTKKLAEKI